MQSDSHGENETPRVRVVRRNDAYGNREGTPKKKSVVPLWIIIAIAAVAYFWYSNNDGAKGKGAGDGEPRRTQPVETQPGRTQPSRTPPVQVPRAPQPQQRRPQACSTCGGRRIVRIPCPCPNCTELSLNNVVLTRHGGLCTVCGGQGGAVAPNGMGVVCPNCGGVGFAVCDKCGGAGEVRVQCPSCAGAQSTSRYASNMKDETISCRVSEKLKTKEKGIK